MWNISFFCFFRHSRSYQRRKIFDADLNHNRRDNALLPIRSIQTDTRTECPRRPSRKRQDFRVVSSATFPFYPKAVIKAILSFSILHTPRGFLGRHKILHLHLFKLPLAKQKLSRADFVAKRLAYLCDAERNGIHSRT